LARNTFSYALKTALLLLFIVLAVVLRAQNRLTRGDSKLVQGIITDGTTGGGIANVHVAASSFTVISDDQGKFSITLSLGDSLRFSHISYLSYCTVFNNDLNHDMLVIALNPKITFLKEVTVTALNETEFRNKILETVPQVSMEEENALENIYVLTQASKFALPLQMDSYQSFREYMKGPQGVVIFSSNGSKGLVRAIKNIALSKTYRPPSTFKRSNNSLRDTK
jgi:hypothetical protein